MATPDDSATTASGPSGISGPPAIPAPPEAPPDAASVAPAPPVNPGASTDEVTVKVDQRDGEIRMFDGAYTRVWQVINGETQVLAHEVEAFLVRVEGSSK